MPPLHRSSPLRRSLCYSVADGGGFSLMVGIGETYIAAFALALGLGEAAAGLITTLPMLAGALLQIASPAAVRRLGSHRRWVAACAALQGLAFIPLVAVAAAGRIAPPALFALVAAYWAAGQAAGPAWNTWMGRLVPGRIRADYFARRQRVQQACIMTGLVAGGIALQAGAAAGRTFDAFVGLFAIACVGRLVSAALLARQHEPAALRGVGQDVPLRDLLRRLPHSAETRVLAFLLTMQVSVQFAAPYFTPFMLRELHLPYGRYMALLAIAYVARIAALPALGAFARRYGVMKLLWLGAVGIVPTSALWTLSDDYRFLMLLQIFGGAVWAAYELAGILIVFETIRPDERTSVLTTYNVGNAAAMTVGSLLGGAVLRGMGAGTAAYFTLFIVSGLGRAASLLWLRHAPAVTVDVTPIALRTDAVRPNAGAIQRPIVSSLPPEPREAAPCASATGADAR